MVFIQPVYRSRDPVLHESLTKVEQIPKLKPGQPQVRKQLLLVDIVHRIYRLEFQDDLTFDDNVRSEPFVKPDATILDLEWEPAAPLPSHVA